MHHLQVPQPSLPPCLRNAFGFVPRRAVFQAGWAAVPAEWRQVSEADAAMWRAVLNIRSEINLLLEKARADKALGASLEAKVRLPSVCATGCALGF